MKNFRRRTANPPCMMTMTHGLARTVLGALTFGTCVHGGQADFFPYYTTLDYRQPQEVAALGLIPVSAAEVFAGEQADAADKNPRPPRPGTIRWGRHADLVVQLAPGRRLVFARAAGYLPCLESPQGRFPFTALAKAEPDPLCLCSWVSVVRSDPTEIVVQWRHVPDPARVVMTETIHETFFISPAGKVRREVRSGTPRLDDFTDPAKLMVQELDLWDGGITELSPATASKAARPAPPVADAPVRTPPANQPAA